MFLLVYNGWSQGALRCCWAIAPLVDGGRTDLIIFSGVCCPVFLPVSSTSSAHSIGADYSSYLERWYSSSVVQTNKTQILQQYSVMLQQGLDTAMPCHAVVLDTKSTTYLLPEQSGGD